MGGYLLIVLSFHKIHLKFSSVLDGLSHGGDRRRTSPRPRPCLRRILVAVCNDCRMVGDDCRMGGDDNKGCIGRLAL